MSSSRLPEAISAGLAALQRAESTEQLRMAFGQLEAALESSDPGVRQSIEDQVEEQLQRAGFQRVRNGNRPAVVLAPSLGEMWSEGEVAAALGRSRLLFRLLEFVACSGPDNDRQALFSAVWDQLYLGESSDNSLYVSLTRLRRKFLRSDLSITATPLGGFALQSLPTAYRWSPTEPNTSPGPSQDPAGNLSPLNDTTHGRDGLVRDIIDAMGTGGGPVTLVGPGGVGKTRLARLAGLRRRDQPQPPTGGIWFIDLSEATSAADLHQAIGQALDVPLHNCADNESTLAHLGSTLASREPTWLILDNFEQLVGCGEGSVDRLSQEASASCILITSREPLRLAQEVVIPVDGLTVEDGRRLFDDRARTLRPDFELPKTSHDIVHEIVEQLDGVPLAIELAAARVHMMGPEQIRDRLSDALRLLSDRRSSKPARHQTLRATIDWSWQLLTPWEQDALAQCAVFHGGFSVDAAESVIDIAQHPDAPWMLDVLEALVESSLIQRYTPPALPQDNRLRLPRTIWQFANEQLGSGRTRTEIRRRHAAWAAQYGNSLMTAYRTATDVQPRHRLDMERDNLLSAFEACRETDWTTGLDVLLLLGPILRRTGPIPVLIEMLDNAQPHANDAQVIPLMMERARAQIMLGQTRQAQAVLAEAWDLCGPDADHPMAGHVRRWMGESSYELGQLEDAHTHLQHAVQLYRAREDASGQGRALTVIGTLLRLQGDLDAASESLQEALVLLCDASDREYEAVARTGLGAIQKATGHSEDALTHYEQALAINEALQFKSGMGHVMENMANLLTAIGQTNRAVELYQQAIALARERGSKTHEAALRMNLGTAHEAQDRGVEAEQLYRSALRAHEQHDRQLYAGHTLGCLGRLLWAQGKLDLAVEHLDRGLSLLHSVGARRNEAVFRAVHGAVLADQDKLDGAEQDLAAAHAVFEEIEDQTGRGLCRVLEGHLELARARASTTQRGRSTHLDNARSRIDAAQQPGPPSTAHPEGQASPSDGSIEIRLALQRLQRRLAMDCDG